MDDVATRLVISTRCLYDVLAELQHRHPDTAWSRKPPERNQCFIPAKT